MQYNITDFIISNFWNWLIINFILKWILGSEICVLISIIWKYYIFNKRKIAVRDILQILLIGLASWCFIFGIFLCIIMIALWMILYGFMCIIESPFNNQKKTNKNQKKNRR